MVDAVTRDATHLAPAGAGSTDASGAESAIPLGAGTEQGLTGDAPPAFPEPSELIEPGRGPSPTSLRHRWARASG